MSKIVELNKNEQKPSVPINYQELITDLLMSRKIFKSIKDLEARIIQDGFKMSEFRISLNHILDLHLSDLFLTDFDKFYMLLQEGLYSQLSMNFEIKEFMDREEFRPEYLHIIIELEPSFLIKREVNDLSQDLTIFLSKYMCFTGRNLTKPLDKETQYMRVQYECSSCQSQFNMFNNLRAEKDMKPYFDLINKKCKNQRFRESDIIEKKTVEHGSFSLGDLVLENYKYELRCKIFRNINYFIKKFESIGLNEEIRVLGVLRTDDSKIFDKTNKNKIKNNIKYLEVIDIISGRTHKIDDEIIKILKQKIEKDIHYRQILIDAIFPFTFLIDVFFAPKLTVALTYISGGFWNTQYRETLNAIIGGGKSTFKSSTVRSFTKIINDRNVLYFESKKVTLAGLIGTTIRNKDNGQVEIRAGAIPLYSNGTIFLDETQEMPFDCLNVFRCLEKGDTEGFQDALGLVFPAKESVCLLQNFVKSKYGFYDKGADIIENLGWKAQNAFSFLDRFDLFCNITELDKYIQKFIADNERKESNKTLYSEMAKLLEVDDYPFPEDIKEERDKIIYILKQYFWKAKECFRLTILPEQYKEYIRGIYDEALDKVYKEFKDEIELSQRAKNSCYKVLKGLCALRLDTEVNYLDYNFFKLKAINLITVFRDSRLFDTAKFSEDEIFFNAFKDLTKTKVIKIFSIKEIIDYFVNYLKRNYYNTINLNLKNDKDEKDAKIIETEKSKVDIDAIINTKIENIITVNKYSLSTNYKFRKLLENNEDKIIKELGYKRALIQDKTVLINESQNKIDNRDDTEIIRKIYDRVNEMLEANTEKKTSRKQILQILSLAFNQISIENLNDYLDLLVLNNAIKDL